MTHIVKRGGHCLRCLFQGTRSYRFRNSDNGETSSSIRTSRSQSHLPSPKHGSLYGIRMKPASSRSFVFRRSTYGSLWSSHADEFAQYFVMEGLKSINQQSLAGLSIMECMKKIGIQFLTTVRVRICNIYFSKGHRSLNPFNDFENMARRNVQKDVYDLMLNFASICNT